MVGPFGGGRHVGSVTLMMMMMMMRRFVKHVLNSPQMRYPSQSNRWDLRCRANTRGESFAVRRAAGRLFQICGPATTKLLITSVVVVLGMNSVPVSADRRCRLLAIAEIAWQSRALISQDYWGDIKEDWSLGTPAGSRGGAVVGGLGDEVRQKLKLFCETTHNIYVKIKQTTVAVTWVDILNDITSKILGGRDITMDVPLHKYWGDMSPLSHRDRRPWWQSSTR